MLNSRRQTIEGHPNLSLLTPYSPADVMPIPSGFEYNHGQVAIDPTASPLTETRLVNAVYASLGLTNQEIGTVTSRSVETINESLAQTFAQLNRLQPATHPQANRASLAFHMFRSTAFEVVLPGNRLDLDKLDRWLLIGLSRGATADTIGAKYSLSPRTVRNHIGEIGLRHGLHGRNQVILAGFLSGQIPLPHVRQTARAS